MDFLKLISQSEAILGILFFNVLLLFTYYPNTTWDQAIVKRSFRISWIFFVLEVFSLFLLLFNFLAIFPNAFEGLYAHMMWVVYIQNILFLTGGFYFFVLLIQKEINPIGALLAPEVVVVVYALSKSGIFPWEQSHIALVQSAMVLLAYWFMIRQINTYKRY